MAFWSLDTTTKPSSKLKRMGKKHALFLLLLMLLLLLQFQAGSCRYVVARSSPSGVVLEGRASSYSCKQTHGVGVMPCTTTVLGNVFLVLVYAYLMFLAARLLYEGSEILVELLSPGLTGGVFLPLLSAFPDVVIILGKLLLVSSHLYSNSLH